MKLALKISIQRIAIMLLLLALFIPCIMAQDVDNIPAKSFAEWVRQHYAIIGLILSETIAFLPTKAGGILQVFVNIFQSLSKKKST